ncbi:hypothetical protein P4B35_23775 [Pontiellaceae bacterium B12227]|nr:hypothetical protein [Pontiellaceae bacterium B12227]
MKTPVDSVYVLCAPKVTLNVLSLKNMKCQCHNLPAAFYLEEAPKGFEKTLIHKDSGNWVWLGLCSKCGTYWSVEEWDKYSYQVVVRVADKDKWKDQDTVAIGKNLLLKSRGGLSDDECRWAECHQKQVKGVYYCLDHLWDTGARK